MTTFSLVHDATSFSLSNAHALAQAAELAYADFPTIERTVLGEWGFRDVNFCDLNDSQAFVAEGSHAVVVAIRGTEANAIGDWVTDGNCAMVNGPLRGRVHAGFYEALSHIWMHLDQWVTQATQHRYKTVWVTGHSLGAALATLAVARWLERGRRVAGLYTFGQPRTGDDTFARNFNFELKPAAFRLVNNSDFVTRVPPRAMGYSHTGTFKYFTAQGELVDDISWWNQFLDQWSGSLTDILGWIGDGVTDHRMTVYRSLIENLLPSQSPSDWMGQNFARFLDLAKRAWTPSQVTPRRRAA